MILRAASLLSLQHHGCAGDWPNPGRGDQASPVLGMVEWSHRGVKQISYVVLASDARVPETIECHRGAGAGGGTGRRVPIVAGGQPLFPGSAPLEAIPACAVCRP